MMKLLIGGILIVYFFFVSLRIVRAESNRYLTVVHPVRGREIWKDVKSFTEQAEIVTKRNLPATWLLQYAAIKDQEIINLTKNLPDSHEFGIWLEVDETLATDSQVPYIYGSGDWARSDKVLLSGYSPKERIRLIDKVFSAFKGDFGYYPKSVGAWYIDTLSLNHLVKKYSIETVVDVADQYVTDTYGVWGKPWGIPYYPSIFNSLIPAADKNDRLPVVKIQWAARDPVRGYGLTVNASTYSIQANDYVGHGKDTRYFSKLLKDYLNAPNRINQLTIGLEVGQEGKAFSHEYQKQLDELKKTDARSVTMKDFASIFRDTHEENPQFIIRGIDSENNSLETIWYSSSSLRAGIYKEGKIVTLQDLRVYRPRIIFPDIFQKEESPILKRIIPAVFDRLILKNEYRLSDNTGSLDLKSNTNFEINLKEDGNNEGTIFLTPKEIKYNDSIIFKTDNQSSWAARIIECLIRMLKEYELHSSSFWTGSFRYSIISGKLYFGYWLQPEQLVGISTQPPFCCTYHFRFQTLARFKSLPLNNIKESLAVYLVNSFNHSTIKRVGQL